MRHFIFWGGGISAHAQTRICPSPGFYAFDFGLDFARQLLEHVCNLRCIGVRAPSTFPSLNRENLEHWRCAAPVDPGFPWLAGISWSRSFCAIHVYSWLMSIVGQIRPFRLWRPTTFLPTFCPVECSTFLFLLSNRKRAITSKFAACQRYTDATSGGRTGKYG